MKKGISFVILLATISVVSILASAVIISGNNTTNTSKKMSFAMEINSLQVAVDSYVSLNKGNYPIEGSVVLDVSNIDEMYKNQFLQNGETITDGKIILSGIDYEKIGYKSLKYGNESDGENDIYAISTVTGKVYYLKGFKVSGELYFTLTDDLKKFINYSTNVLDKDSNSYVVFSTTNSTWTNEDVEVTVRISSEYELDQILVNGVSYTSYTTLEQGNSKVYTITSSGNYTVDVKCHSTAVESKVINAKYSVSNVDKTSPNFVINSLQNKVEGNDSQVIGYVKLDLIEDDLSGIKFVKYEKNSAYDSRNFTTEQIATLKSHFEVYGTDVVSNIVLIEKDTRTLTIYAQDNAGNWLVETIDINL